MPQNTSHILMIRPHQFSYNFETAESNSFQNDFKEGAELHKKALAEFDGFVDILRKNGVQVWVVQDTEYPITPDAIFPNNWFSMHENSTVVLYPMMAQNRRLERRADILQHLGETFSLQEIVDLTTYEADDQFLEGTGSMVLDRDNNICYASISKRTHLKPLQHFCHAMNFSFIQFLAMDGNGNPIYHTNVILCVGQQFMVVCFECIPSIAERNKIKMASAKVIIEITLKQLNHFAGNMLEVINDKGEHLIVMSQQAYQSLTASQIAQLEIFAKTVTAPLYTIEAIGGGSARCMLAEIFLPLKNTETP